MKKIKKNQSGRSMVEMLGVLAVIGVLSVGGIAGYRMAMNYINRNNLLKLVQMAYLAAQTEGKKDYSIFDEDNSTKLFCENYLGNEHPYCKTPTTDNRYIAYDWQNSQGNPAIWSISRESGNAACSCTSDVKFYIGRVSLKMCKEIIEIVKNNFTEKEILGFSGYGTSHFNKSMDETYKLTCTGNGTNTERTSLHVFFKIPPKEELGDTCACSYSSCKDICRFDDFR